MNALSFSPEHNSPNKSDATGAFIPEAKAFQKLHGGSLVFIDNTQLHAGRAKQVLTALKAHADHSLDVVAFFGHGVSSGTPSFGFDLRGGSRGLKAEILADELNRVLKSGGKILMYCCLLAKDPRGFAWVLSHETELAVYAHSTAGHTTWNPYVVKYDGTTAKPWIAENAPHWAEWVHKLHNDQTFRLSYWKTQ